MSAGILFDLFGTLVDYEPDRRNFQFADALDSLKFKGFDEITLVRYQQAWEDAFAISERLSAESGLEFHMDEPGLMACKLLGLPETPEFVSALVADYMGVWVTGVREIPGATTLIKRLAKHYTLGVITNTHYPPMVYTLLHDLGLGGVFQVVVTSAEFGRPKPDPTIFRHALSAMNLLAENSFYIGDSFEHDYKGAQAAGIDCYLVGRHARVPRGKQLRSLLDLPIYFQTGR